MATCRYTRDPTSHLVESQMVSRYWIEPRRTHKYTVVTSVVSNVEDGTRISGGQLGIRDGSAPCGAVKISDFHETAGNATLLSSSRWHHENGSRKSFVCR